MKSGGRRVKEKSEGVTKLQADRNSQSWRGEKNWSSAALWETFVHNLLFLSRRLGVCLYLMRRAMRLASTFPQTISQKLYLAGFASFCLVFVLFCFLKFTKSRYSYFSVLSVSSQSLSPKLVLFMTSERGRSMKHGASKKIDDFFLSLIYIGSFFLAFHVTISPESRS